MPQRYKIKENYIDDIGYKDLKDLDLLDADVSDIEMYINTMSDHPIWIELSENRYQYDSNFNIPISFTPDQARKFAALLIMFADSVESI